MTVVEIVSIIIFSTVGAIKGTGDYSGQGNKDLYLNIYAGASKVENASSSWKVAHGGSIGYFIHPNIDIGIESLTTRTSMLTSDRSWEYTDTPVLFKVNFHTDLILPGLYFGAMLGKSLRELTYSGKSGDSYETNSTAYGFRFGNEFSVSTAFKMGVNLTYLNVAKSIETISENDTSTSITFDKFDYLVLLTEFKYYF